MRSGAVEGRWRGGGGAVEGRGRGGGGAVWCDGCKTTIPQKLGEEERCLGGWAVAQVWAEIESGREGAGRKKR